MGRPPGRGRGVLSAVALDGAVIFEGETLGDLAVLNEEGLPGDLDLAAAGAGLADGLRGVRARLLDALRRETGFVPRDVAEIVDGAIGYAEAYAAHPSTALPSPAPSIEATRRMSLVDVPVGTVAAILPHNAFLPLALSCGLNALRAGNRVVLRAPQQSALSASLFAEALAAVPEIAPWVAVAVCSARPFVDSFLGSSTPGLLHFFGGSRNAADLVRRGFDAGKPVLIDGEGNAWVYVDRDCPADRAAELLVAGAFRYNGQTCTSINGALVHPSRYEEVSARVAARTRGLTYGSGEADAVGPVFDEAQAAWCQGRIESGGGTVLVGGERRGTRLAPTVVAEPDETSEWVREGLFGPALWLAPGDADAFRSRWRANRYPLCAAVLGSAEVPAAWATSLPGVARLVVDGDPSVEDPFEFWGGYPPSGQNAVSPWSAKYRRTVQLDEP